MNSDKLSMPQKNLVDRDNSAQLQGGALRKKRDAEDRSPQNSPAREAEVQSSKRVCVASTPEKCIDKTTPLHSAAEGDGLEGTQNWLKEWGEMLNAVGEGGNVPLYHTVDEGRRERLESLVSAVRKCKVEILNNLLRGAEESEGKEMLKANKYEAFRSAARGDRVDIFKLLLEVAGELGGSDLQLEMLRADDYEVLRSVLSKCGCGQVFEDLLDVLEELLSEVSKSEACQKLRRVVEIMSSGISCNDDSGIGEAIAIVCEARNYINERIEYADSNETATILTIAMSFDSQGYDRKRRLGGRFIKQLERAIIKFGGEEGPNLSSLRPDDSVDANLSDIALEGIGVEELRANNYRRFRLAARGGDIEMVNYLLGVARELGDSNLQLEMLKADHYGAFRCAAEYGEIGVVKHLLEVAEGLEQGSKSKMLKANKYEAFAFAAGGGYIEVVNYLLEVARELGSSSLQLEMLKVDGYRAFRYAAGNGKIGVVEYLLEIAEGLKQGSKSKMLKADDYGAFRCAAEYGEIGVVKHLLEVAEGLEQGSKSKMLKANKYEAFAFAAGGGYIEVVNYLLEVARELGSSSLQLEMLKVDGYRAFRYAAGNGKIGVVEYLLEIAEGLKQGSKLKMLKANKYEAFTFAAKRGRIEVVKYLLEAAGKEGKELQLEMLKANKYEAFRSAAVGGHKDIVGHLLEVAGELGGSDLQLGMLKAVEYGAFRSAAKGGHKDLVDYLLTVTEELESGSKLKMLKADKYGAFRFAVEGGHKDLVDHLLEVTEELEQGSKLKMLEADKYGAFRSVAKRGHVEVIDRLLKVVEELEEGGKLLFEMLKAVDWFRSEGCDEEVMKKLLIVVAEKLGPQELGNVFQRTRDNFGQINKIQVIVEKLGNQKLLSALNPSVQQMGNISSHSGNDSDDVGGSSELQNSQREAGGGSYTQKRNPAGSRIQSSESSRGAADKQRNLRQRHNSNDSTNSVMCLTQELTLQEYDGDQGIQNQSHACLSRGTAPGLQNLQQESGIGGNRYSLRNTPVRAKNQPSLYLDNTTARQQGLQQLTGRQGSPSGRST